MVRFWIAVVIVLALFSALGVSFSLSENTPNIFAAPEQLSPSDWIKEEQIKVYDSRVILDIENANWSQFTNTNSMDPFLDEDANAIEIVPKDPLDIHVGDIISYHTVFGVLIHRVIETGEDDQGIYYLVQGDNNSFRDPFKIRFEDVEGVLVAIIY
ncbi:MAG: hypothetical protein Q8R37_00625 [Nanoarchaeota archaeon]|nr:hypothetical protein [Nanoarchaeota archaeon]